MALKLRMRIVGGDDMVEIKVKGEGLEKMKDLDLKSSILFCFTIFCQICTIFVD